MGIKGQNKLYTSRYSDMAWEYLENGCSPQQVLEILRGVDPTFKISLPTIYDFQAIMEKEHRGDEETDALITLGGTLDPKTAIKYDGVLLDGIIALGLEDLKARKLKLTLPVILKAMEMKKDLLGASYRGQTIWGLMDYQQQFDQLVEVLAKRCPATVFEEIIEDLKELGWAATADKMGSVPMDDEEDLSVLVSEEDEV